MTDADLAHKTNQGQDLVRVDRPATISPEHILALERIVGPENVSMDDYARVKFSTGKATEEAMYLRNGAGRAGTPQDCFFGTPVTVQSEGRLEACPTCECCAWYLN